MKTLWLLLFCCFSAAVWAQNPVKWTTEVRKIKKGEYEIVFTADIQDGWAIYSQFIDEGGPIPTAFTFDALNGAQLQGKAEETSDHKIEGMDHMFGMEIVKYKKQVLFKQKVSTPSAGGVTVKGFVTYMCCDSESCLPPRDVPFSAVLK